MMVWGLISPRCRTHIVGTKETVDDDVGFDIPQMSDSHSRDKRDSRDDDDDDDVGLHVLGYRVDILGTNCDQCVIS